jgi:hypothetical protein
LLSNRKCDPTNVYSRNTLHTSTYIHALHDINQSICIANYKSINLNESGLDAWAVHMARHFVERARHEARCRPLAAIRHTQQFNSFTEHKKNIIAARAAGVFSPRVSTTSWMGLRSEHKSDDTRRGEWRSNRRAAAARGLLRILSNSRRAPRRTARKGARCLGRGSRAEALRGVPTMEEMKLLLVSMGE